MNIVEEEKITFLKSVIESILFVSGDSLSVSEITAGLQEITKNVQIAMDSLKNDYLERDSGVFIHESGGKYQIRSSPHTFNYIRKFLGHRKKETLSKAMTEVLAIIVYKQPITRVEIEKCRGVKSGYLINVLISKNLIKAVGQKEVPGRPTLYSVTKDFLHYFGLKSLDDLPPLQEVKELNFDEI